MLTYLSLTEIIKELEHKEDGGKFKTWLQDKDHDRLFEPKCLERALLVATKKDSDRFIGMLVEKGAKNFEECLTVAMLERKPKARAIFLLIKAVNRQEDDVEDEGFQGLNVSVNRIRKQCHCLYEKLCSVSNEVGGGAPVAT